MSRSPQIPPDAVILRSYTELEAEADAFFGDHYDELLIVGPPGIGKIGSIQGAKQRTSRAVPLP